MGASGAEFASQSSGVKKWTGKTASAGQKQDMTVGQMAEAEQNTGS